MGVIFDFGRVVLSLSETLFNSGTWKSHIVILVPLFTLSIIYWYIRSYAHAREFGVFPSVLRAWFEAFRFVYESHIVIEKRIQKEGAKRRSFQVSTPSRFIIVTVDPGVLKELGNADENVLSMQAAANERNSTEYILCASIHSDPYHVEIIAKKLTSRIKALLPEIVEEICLTFSENSTISNEWTLIHDSYSLLSRCISAATNRVLVGQSLCRDEEYLDCLVQLSKWVSRTSLFCDLAPRTLKSLIPKLLIRRSHALKIFLSKVGPLIEQRRLRIARSNSKWDEKPDDVIQWIIEATSPTAPLYELCIRILYINFSAIHTTSVSITQALYDLATHREFQDPIRDEIEYILKSSGGWTMHALTKMRKLDSSLKESQRLHPVTTATMMRKAQKHCTLSDGTHLPKGWWVVAAAYSINHSAQYHTKPENFNANRFVRSVKQGGHEIPCKISHPEEGFLSFGIGKHACPGRSFAVTELKVLLAYIICNYDFKISDGSRPRNKFSLFLCSPDFSAPLLLKKRVDFGNPFLT